MEITTTPLALAKFIDPERAGESAENTDIALRLSIAERVQRCTRQKESLLKAIELLQDVPTEHRHELNNPESGCLHIERVAWQELVDATGIKSAMSVKSREKLDNQLFKQNRYTEEPPLPPFTEASVFGFLDNIYSDMPQMIQDAVAEVFDWLRPSSRHYKTNDEFMIGDKVILSWLVESNYRHGFRVNYHRVAHVDALGNVLSMLDGKGVTKHPHTLSNKINTAWADSDTYSDEYLIAKGFKNNNAHIRFLRPDLIAQINQTAGPLWLRRESQQSRGFSH